VIFDYSRLKMILEPNEHFDELYEYDMSGIFLVAEGPDFRRFKVHRVLAGSPAAEAGVREGDVIVAVDGRPTREFTLEQIRQLFKQEGRKVELVIQRDGEQLEISLELRRLI